MSEQSTIHDKCASPQIAKITLANPPVNLVAGETVVRLIEIVAEPATDPDIQVVLFDSATPDFFYNHFDLAAAVTSIRIDIDHPGARQMTPQLASKRHPRGVTQPPVARQPRCSVTTVVPRC